MFPVDWLYGVPESLGLRQKEAKILFLGLENAGKANLLHLLKDERLVQHQPTQYPTSEEFSFGKIKFKAFDLGGHEIARRVLKDYEDMSFLMLWCTWWMHMIERLPESKKELDGLLSDEALANVPFLILGSDALLSDGPSVDVPILIQGDRIDIPSAVSKEEMRDYLGLTNFTPGKGKGNLPDSVRPLEVFMCSIVRKMGYREGFKWLSQYIK